MADAQERIQQLKNEGNEYFKSKKFQDAAQKYSEALALKNKDSAVKGVLLSNRAACYLQLGRFQDCIADASNALIADNSITKALYRRAQAYKQLGDLDNAFIDFREVVRLLPNDKEIVQEMTKLTRMIQEKQQVNTVRGMLFVLRDTTLRDKHEETLGKLVMLTKEGEKAIELAKEGGVTDMHNLIVAYTTTATTADTTTAATATIPPTKKSVDGALRILSHLCNSKEISLEISQKIGYDLFLPLLQQPHKGSGSDDLDVDIVATAMSILVHLITAALEKQPQDENSLKMLFNISVAFVSVIKNGNPKNKPHALSEIILLPWKRQQALDFVEKYLKDILLLSDLNKEDEKGLVAVILSKLISAADTGKDDSLKPIKTRAQITINSWLQSSDTDMNIKALSALSCVLLADAELGVDIFLSEVQSIVEAIDGLEFEKPHVKDAIQLITAEIIAHASSHKNFLKVFEKNTEQLDELLKMLQSQRLDVIARVDVAMAKLASANADVRERILKDDGKATLHNILHLLKPVNKQQQQQQQQKRGSNNNNNNNNNNNQKSPSTATAICGSVSSVRQWAIEALSFLSLHPVVKEQIMKDNEALDILFSLIKEEDKTLWYGAVSTLLSLTRFPPRLDEVEQMKQQLQSYAAGGGAQALQKLEPHKFDTEKFVEARCTKLVEKGVTSLLVLMSKEDESDRRIKTTSENTKLAISQIFVSLATAQKVRGKIVQDGGVKALLSLVNSPNQQISTNAAHALAKIAISIDPKIGYKDAGTATRMVSPLVALLKSEDGLQQFEALMGLTNLTLYGEETTQLICKDSTVSSIEMLQLSNNELLQRAASELLCNLLMYSDMLESYGPNGRGVERRLKIWGGLSGSDDLPTKLAASGALAMISMDAEACQSIVDILEIELFLLLANEDNGDVQHRATEVLKNIINLGRDAAQKVASKGGVLVLSKVLQTTKNPQAKENTNEALDKLTELKLLDTPVDINKLSS